MLIVALVQRSRPEIYQTYIYGALIALSSIGTALVLGTLINQIYVQLSFWCRGGLCRVPCIDATCGNHIYLDRELECLYSAECASS